jgi:hypothetical protein
MTPEEYRQSLSDSFGQVATAVRILTGVIATGLACAAVVWAARGRGGAATGLADRLLAYVPRDPVLGAGRASFWMTVSGVSVGVAAAARIADPDDVRRWRGLRPAEAEEVVGNWLEVAVRGLGARFRSGRSAPLRRRSRGRGGRRRS